MRSGEKGREAVRFPIFIELDQKKVVVIGAGAIASRRIRAFLEYGALVTAVAPEAEESVRRLAEEGTILWKQRTAEKEDIAGAFLVAAATDRREVNHQAALWCREKGIPVNVADKKEECDFYFPGLARVGSLTAGVCAGGTDHKLAKAAAQEIRELLEERFGGQADCGEPEKDGDS